MHWQVILFILGTVADVGTTYYGIRHASMSELSPLWDRFMRKYGSGTAMALNWFITLGVLVTILDYGTLTIAAWFGAARMLLGAYNLYKIWRKTHA